MVEHGRTDDQPDDPRLSPDPAGLVLALACLLIAGAVVAAVLLVTVS